MDAFAITGVNAGNDWFRVQAAVGGVDGPARLFPRVHVVTSADIADLAAGGRRIYFQQPGEHPSLVPLARQDAETFDAAHLPVEDIAQFAFVESATDADIELLLAIRTGRPIVTSHASGRVEALGWAALSELGGRELTPVGRELLRRRLA